MFKLDRSTQFKRDLKKFQYKEEVIRELQDVLKILISRKNLPEKYVDHPLSGPYKGYRDCHIKPDIILIYKINISENSLYLARLGSHSELF